MSLANPCAQTAPAGEELKPIELRTSRDAGGLAGFLNALEGFELRSQQGEMLVRRERPQWAAPDGEAGTGTGKSLLTSSGAAWALTNNERFASPPTHCPAGPIDQMEIPDDQSHRSGHPCSVLKGRCNYLCPRASMLCAGASPKHLEELGCWARFWFGCKAPERRRCELNLNGMPERLIWAHISEVDGCNSKTALSTPAGQPALLQGAIADEGAQSWWSSSPPGRCRTENRVLRL